MVCFTVYKIRKEIQRIKYFMRGKEMTNKIIAVVMLIPMFIIALKINDIITISWTLTLIPLLLQLGAVFGLAIIGKINK